MIEQSAETRLPLFNALPGLRGSLSRVPLSTGPSPVSPLAALGECASIGDLWLKNDGVYGTGYGGNKPRKLEFILADALRRRSPAILTTGALATNHGLATALYAKPLGLKVGLLLTYEEPGEGICEHLCRMQDAGAALHYTSSLPWTALSVPYFALRYRSGHRWPYLLMSGGSSAVGALGYVNAGLELADQVRAGELPEPRTIMLPLGSGGTAAGLLLGLRLAGLDSHLLAVAVTRAPTAWRTAVLRLARASARLLARAAGQGALAGIELDGFEVLDDWLAPGFGRASEVGQSALSIAEETEGLRLEPTYTAKTLAALLALGREGRLRGPVLYWHTYNAIPAPPLTEPAAWRRLPRAFHRFCR